MFYAAKELENLVSNEDLHIGKRCIIPTPRFVVFYNGPARKEDIWTEKLSDSFELPTEKPELELTVTFININYGHNQDLMKKCETLSGYSLFIKHVREYSRTMSLEDAIDKAINECIEEGILAEFLDKNRREAGQVILYEFDEKEFETKLYNYGLEEGMAKGMARGRTEGRAEGRAEGKAEGRAEFLNKLMINMNLSLDQAMDIVDIPVEDRKMYRDTINV